jgi:hypothetical protein
MRQRLMHQTSDVRNSKTLLRRTLHRTRSATTARDDSTIIVMATLIFIVAQSVRSCCTARAI